MEKIRVALFIRGFHNGGIEKVFESYFTHMDLSPFEIHVITHMPNIPEKKKMFEDMGCVIHELSKVHGHKLNRTNFKEYRELFSSVKFDIVHNNMPDNLLPLYFAKKSGVKKRILHAHNNYTDGYENKNLFVAKLFKLGFQINASKATDLVAVSRLAGETAFGKYADKMVIMPNAIDMGKYQFNEETRKRIREQLDCKRQFLVGHVGRYENDQKNQEFVLTVFKRLLEKKSDSKLLMIGDGKRLDEFKKLSSDMGIDEKVIFTGNVSNIQDYFQAMDAFVLPSRKEGLGIVAVEAQAAGLNCILSDKVPDEAKISEQVISLPIDNVECWVEELLRIAECDRKGCQVDMESSGYDISTEIVNLERLYIE